MDKILKKASKETLRKVRGGNDGLLPGAAQLRLECFGVKERILAVSMVRVVLFDTDFGTPPPQCG